MKPKIYFVVTVVSSVNAFLLGHLRLLSTRYDITVFVNTSDLEFLTKQGVYVKVVSCNIIRKVNLLRDLLCLIGLIAFFLKDKPLAVHSITPKAGLLAMLAAFFSRVPFRVHTFTGQVWANKTGPKRWLLKILDCLIGKLSTYNIVDSHSQKDFLIQENVLTKKKSIVFGSGSVSGVDLNKFKYSKNAHDHIRAQLSIPPNSFVFIYLGRLNKDKGVLDLAFAFSQIQDKRAYLIMVGPDELDLNDQIENLAGDNRTRLRMVGFSNEPYRYLSASDVLCLPSYREGFGSVIIEAAAMGVPAIASNIYGISDAIQNKKTGLLHQPKDVDAIRNCMEKFLFNQALVNSYGRVANKVATIKFDAKLISQYWLKFYLTHAR